MEGIKKVIILLALIFFIPSLVQASPAPFSDNFESYNLGSIQGQGDWHSNYSECGTVQSDVVYSGSRALKLSGGNTAYKTGEAVPVGDVRIHFNANEWGSGDYAYLFLNNADNTKNVVILRWYLMNNKLYIYSYGIDNPIFEDISLNSWHTLDIRWNAAYSTYEVMLDNNVWFPYPCASSDFGEVSTIKFLTGLYQDRFFYVDDIDYAIPPVIGGINPILTPTSPLEGQTSIVDYDDIHLSGNIKIPTASPYVWTELLVQLMQADGVYGVAKQIPLPNLVGGQSYDYTATTTIDAAYGDKAFYTEYAAQGHLAVPPYTNYVFYFPSNAYITQNNMPSGIPFIPVNLWTPPPPQDCNGLSGIDMLLCNFGNMLLGAFVPSADSVNALQGTMAAFSHKFPFAYISAFNSAIQDINNSISADKPLTVSILGHSGQLDLSFWNNENINIGGISMSLGSIFNTLIAAIVMVVFAFWAIGFLHRIF